MSVFRFTNHWLLYTFLSQIIISSIIQDNQKVSVHLTITVQKTRKIQTPLHEEKTGVWVGMSRRHIVRPIFFSVTLNSQQYCDNIVYPFIVQLKEDGLDKAYFQQDGTTAHAAHMSVALLDDAFADRIISKTVWPPRSPDLSPPDFFLWGAMKNSVYSNTILMQLMS